MRLFDEIPYLENDTVILKQITDKDAGDMKKMVVNDAVYKYLPTFLFERQYDDIHKAIAGLYGELFGNKESLILGIFPKDTGRLCGLAEFYGYKEILHKTCIGYRLDKPQWGKGLATETVSLMVDYLYGKVGIEIITASTMIENKASARVLEKNGFIKTAAAVPEGWGYEQPTVADKWFR
ncbi:MAG: GNAT family N-acetyltransferase [Ruminiclostridium sp.]|nr:GNAT family N-acetyltransferase [Ruminiclostridium sp.]